MPAGPVGVDDLAVAGDARPLLDDRLPAADDAVDERRLAHVGAADDGDDGRWLIATARVAAASRGRVGTTSTGWGRSSGRVPVQEHAL